MYLNGHLPRSGKLPNIHPLLTVGHKGDSQYLVLDFIFLLCTWCQLTGFTGILVFLGGPVFESAF